MGWDQITSLMKIYTLRVDTRKSPFKFSKKLFHRDKQNGLQLRYDIPAGLGEEKFRFPVYNDHTIKT